MVDTKDKQSAVKEFLHEPTEHVGVSVAPDRVCLLRCLPDSNLIWRATELVAVARVPGCFITFGKIAVGAIGVKLTSASKASANLVFAFGTHWKARPCLRQKRPATPSRLLPVPSGLDAPDLACERDDSKCCEFPLMLLATFGEAAVLAIRVTLARATGAGPSGFGEPLRDPFVAAIVIELGRLPRAQQIVSTAASR